MFIYVYMFVYVLMISWQKVLIFFEDPLCLTEPYAIFL